MNKTIKDICNNTESLFSTIVLTTLLSLIFFIIAGCKSTTKIVATKQSHVEAIHDTLIHHDAIIQRDTVTNNTTTIIRELDSLQMAQYGIQLASQQRAWLIDRQSLQRQISELKNTSTTYTAVHDTIRDTIPITYPVEVIKEVNKQTWLQQTFMYVGIAATILLLITLLIRYIQTK